MSEKTFKTYEVSYHILNKAKVYAKTKEEAAEWLRRNWLRPRHGSTLSIQHIWEPDEDYIIESTGEVAVRLSPSYKLSMVDEPPISTDEEFPLGSL